jgi:hypothetical protein
VSAHLEQPQGDVAPTVERLPCKQRVVGSNPTVSTERDVVDGGRTSRPVGNAPGRESGRRGGVRLPTRHAPSSVSSAARAATSHVARRRFDSSTGYARSRRVPYSRCASGLENRGGFARGFDSSTLFQAALAQRRGPGSKTRTVWVRVPRAVPSLDSSEVEQPPFKRRVAVSNTARGTRQLTEEVSVQRAARCRWMSRPATRRGRFTPSAPPPWPPSCVIHVGAR